MLYISMVSLWLSICSLLIFSKRYFLLTVSLGDYWDFGQIVYFFFSVAYLLMTLVLFYQCLNFWGRSTYYLILNMLNIYLCILIYHHMAFSLFFLVWCLDHRITCSSIVFLIGGTTCSKLRFHLVSRIDSSLLNNFYRQGSTNLIFA